MHKTAIDAFIFHSHSTTERISPVIRTAHIMYGAGHNILPLPLSSAAVHLFRAHDKPHLQQQSLAYLC